VVSNERDYVHCRGSIHQIRPSEKGHAHHARARAQSHTGSTLAPQWGSHLFSPLKSLRDGPGWLGSCPSLGRVLFFSRSPPPTLLPGGFLGSGQTPAIFLLRSFLPFRLTVTKKFSLRQCDFHLAQKRRRNVEDGPHLPLATVTHTRGSVMSGVCFGALMAPLSHGLLR
jgi:hypothetical protein